MQNINLEEQRIKVEGSWLSADDLRQRIEEKMKAGDLKIAELAEALERLSLAVENSKTLEIKLALPKNVYNELKARGRGDDKECVRKAIMTFIAKDAPKEALEASVEQAPEIPMVEEVSEVPEQKTEAAPVTPPPVPPPLNPTPPPMMESNQTLKLFEGSSKVTIIKCIKCKSPIEITAGTNPEEIRCPHCSALGRLKLQQDNNNGNGSPRFKDHFLG